MAKERVCLCCGKKYNYCPNCGDTPQNGMTGEFDSAECKEIFNAVSAYNMELISADAVKTVLKKYNVTDFSKYEKSIADKLKEINGINVEAPAPKEEKKEETSIPERTGFMKRDSFKKKNNEDKANA